MIRINLLPHRELARVARRRQFNVLLALAIGIGVGVALLGEAWISAREANQKARNVYLEQEIAKLDQQIGEIKKIRDETQKLIARKQVVEALQANRTEVVHLFDQMIRILPDGLYLRTFQQSGNVVTVTGYTQSSARVSTLMRSLEDSPWFESPTLVEIKAATVNNLRANEFSLTFKQTVQTAPTEADAGVQGGPQT